MSTGRSVVLRLQPTREAPAAARAAVRDACLAACDADVCDEAMLLTSELVTNAVRHGAGVVTVAVDLDEQTLAVAVGDEAATRPRPRPLDADATDGRGLHIVGRLCATWGVRDGDSGDAQKFVWFRLPRHR